MDPIVLTVVVKGVGMLLLALGGILALRYGYKLYRDGTGADKDAVELEFLGGKAKAASVGSVVMATAFVWAGLAAYISPNLDKTGENIRIYSFETERGEITSRTFATRTLNTGAATSPEALEGLFRRAIQDSESHQAGSVVQLNGVPASIDFNSLKASEMAGTVTVMADFRAGEQTASMVFTPQIGNGKVTFVPSKSVDESEN